MNLKKCLSILIFLFFTLVCVQTEAFAKPSKSAQSGSKETVTYVVQKGDSVDKISKKYHVTSEEIARWNNLADAAHIRVGQKLKIRVAAGSAPSGTKSGGSASAPERVQYTYVVKKGDSLSKISKKTGVSIDDLKKHNPYLKKSPNKLRAGQTLTLRVRRFDGATGSSRGLPNNGILVDGIELKPGPGYVLRKKTTNYGTALTIGLLMDAFEAYADKYPHSPRFAVGDISAKNGGRLSPHLSHQSGRDIDISYVDKSKEFVGFQKMNANNLDVEKNWFFIEHLLKTEKIQYIFVDYELQKLFYNHAIKHGYTEAQLRPWIEYPHGLGSKMAIMRHAKGHADHMHVRFVCAPTDKDCH